MKKIIIFFMTALIAITSVQIWLTRDRTEQKKEMEKAETKTESPIGGAFTLVDQTGKTVHDTDYRGHVLLVFFGFTHCPDICPVTVSVLSKTMELLGANAAQVTPIFISVDPQRDTPAVMKDFLANFDKRIVGLTGSEAQIRQVADAYKVYYAKALPAAAESTAESPANLASAETEAAKEPAKEMAGDGDYNVDHSAYIYLMGKEGQFIRVFPYNVSDQELAYAVETALK